MLPAMFDKHHCTHIFLYSTWFAVTDRMKISPTIVTIFANHHALCMSVWDGCLESSDVTESKMGSRLQTRLTSLSHLLSCLCTSLFGHVVLLDDNTPSTRLFSSMLIHLLVDLLTWRCPPGRPQNKWLDHLQDSSTHPTMTRLDLCPWSCLRAYRSHLLSHTLQGCTADCRVTQCH